MQLRRLAGDGPARSWPRSRRSPGPSANTPRECGNALPLPRVLQTDPELLLLDEPFSNLDVPSAQHMVDLLLDFRTWPVESPLPKQNGAAPGVPAARARTIILTTHQPKLAEPLAETTLMMKAGAIVSLTTRPQAATAPQGAQL